VVTIVPSGVFICTLSLAAGRDPSGQQGENAVMVSSSVCATHCFQFVEVTSLKLGGTCCVLPHKSSCHCE